MHNGKFEPLGPLSGGVCWFLYYDIDLWMMVKLLFLTLGDEEKKGVADLGDMAR